MKSDRMGTLRDLLESSNQTHLTIYLEARGGVAQLKRQLQSALDEAESHLGSAMSPEEMKAFLAPVEACLKDDRILHQLRGSLGLFRNRSSFRILRLPLDVTFGSHVASTFHVKPLLRWMQWDAEFYFMGIDTQSVHLYQGSQSALRKFDTILFPRRLTELLESTGPLTFKDRRLLSEELKRALSWVNDWMLGSLSESGGKLYIAGEERLTRPFLSLQTYPRTIYDPVAPLFREDRLHEIVSVLREKLRTQARTHLEQALLSFRLAKDRNRAERSISQIAKAAVSGKVKKLVIAENFEVFGKLDPKTGKLAIHPFDLDHEDDDLLDDLAQTVLSSGGEVFVAKREQIPSSAPVLAILGDEMEADCLAGTAGGVVLGSERRAL